MFLKTEGIIIKTNRGVNNDIFITVFTEKAGKIEAVASGAKSSKSQLSSCSKTFIRGEFVFTTGGSVMRLTSCDLIASHFRILDDLDRLAYANYIMELCHLTTSINIVDTEHYNIIKILLERLVTIEIQQLDLIRLIYLSKLSFLTGHRPNLTSQCNQCAFINSMYYFDIQTASVLCKSCMNDVGQVYKMHAKWIDLLDFLISAPVDSIFEVKIHPNFLKPLIEILESFIQYHMQIKVFNSKAFIDQLL